MKAHPDVFKEVHARALSLSDLLAKGLDVAPKLHGNTARFTACPNCGPSSPNRDGKCVVFNDERYYCHACGDHGDIIAAAQRLWGCPPLEAARILLGQTGSGPVALAPKKAGASQDAGAQDSAREYLPKVLREIALAAVKTHPREPTCWTYLTETRKLDPKVLDRAMRLGLLAFLPGNPVKATAFLEQTVGRDALEAAGLWKPDKKMPAMVFRPILGFMPKFQAVESRLARKPDGEERKVLCFGHAEHSGFWWKAESDDTKTVVVEGLIDLLSVASTRFSGNILGLPGVGNWSPELFRRIAQHGSSRFLIAVDADEPGQRQAQAMLAWIAKEGIAKGYLQQPPCKDWNDALIAHVARKKP